MDRGPLRAARPTVGAGGEREHQNTTTAQPQSLRAELPAEGRAAPERRPRHHHTGRRLSWPWLAGILGVVVLGLIGWLLWTNTAGGTSIDSKKYQAVFFTNGQVYFGKLTYEKGEYMKLSNVFYIQPSSSANGNKSAQSSSTTSSSMQLIKLGDEVHGPEDAMMIAKSQVLFYENLRDDGKVAQQIQKYNSGK